MADSAPSAGTPAFAKPGFAPSLLAAALPGVYLLITSTTSPVTSIWPYDFKRMLEFALLLALFLLPAASRPIRAEFAALVAGVPRWAGLPLLGIFGWGVLSAAVNARSGSLLVNSLAEVALLGALILGAFVVAACRRLSGRVFDRVIVGLVALTGLAVGIQELSGVLAAKASGLVFSYDNALLHFAHPRFYNQVQSWTIPALAALPLLFARYRSAKFLCAVVLALQWYIILMSAARGSSLSLVVAILYSSVVFVFLRRPLVGWQAGGLVLGGLLYLLVLLGFETQNVELEMRGDTQQSSSQRAMQSDGGYYGNEGDDSNAFLAQSLGRPMDHSSGRMRMWRGVVGDSLRHPVFGIGPMAYACTDRVWFGHPHNFLLQVMAEWGVPVALAMALLAAAVLGKVSWRLRRDSGIDAENRLLAGLLLAGIIAAAIHSLLSGVPVMPASQVSGMAVCGTLLGLLAPRSHSTSIAQRIVPMLLGVALSIGLLGYGLQEVRTMEARAAALQPGRIMAPRMWQSAKICSAYVQQNGVTN